MAIEISKIFAGTGKGAQTAAKEPPKALGDGDIFSAMGTKIVRGQGVT